MSLNSRCKPSSGSGSSIEQHKITLWLVPLRRADYDRRKNAVGVRVSAGNIKGAGCNRWGGG